MSNFHFLAKDILMIHSSSKTLKIKNKNALLAGAAFCFLLTVSSPVDAQDAARQSQVQAQAEAVAEVQNLDELGAPHRAKLTPHMSQDHDLWWYVKMQQREVFHLN